MSLSDDVIPRRRVLGLLAAAALLPGCFRPMLAEDRSSAALRGRIALPGISDRFDYHLHEALEEHLGAPRAPEFRLDVQTVLSERGLLIRQDNAVTRLQIMAHATWSLYRDGESEPVLTNTLISEAGFDQTSTLYASRTTRRDIEERLARDIGERISRTILARADDLFPAG